MGFVVWGALTAMTLAAGVALALTVGRRFSIGEQLVAAVVTAVSIVVGAVQALGYLDVLYPGILAAVVIALDAIILGVARPGADDRAAFVRRLINAARSSLRWPSALATLVVGACFVYLAIYVLLLPSWGWDAIWYHNAIASFAYQEHSLRWVDSHIPFVNSYPKNTELLSLWNVMFAPDSRLDDAVQWPLALVGIVAIATMCRRAGATPAVSWTLGLCWILMPAVLLNIPSSYNDVAVATLRIAAILFLARADATTAHRFFGALALGVYLGAKVSGLAHAAILGVITAIVLLREIVRSPGRRFGLAIQPIWMSAIVLGFGIATYIRDWVRHQNPVWPAQVTMLGHKFPGTWDWGAFDSPPWQGPGGLIGMWRSFFEPSSLPLVDIRAGGFGPLWTWGLMPLCVVALLLAAVRLVRGRGTPGLLPMITLVVTAMATGAPWWCRHVLGLPAGGFLAVAIVLAHLRPMVGSLAAVVLTIVSMVQVWPMRVAIWEPDRIAEAWSLPANRRPSMRIAPWTHPGIERRDEVMQPGDAAIYDDSVAFVYLLWRGDWKNRVLYRPLKRTSSTKEWLDGLEADRVRWAVIGRGSRAARTLKEAGWISLGECSAEGSDVWMKPRDK